jgi:hypothetical protein
MDGGGIEGTRYGGFKLRFRDSLKNQKVRLSCMSHSPASRLLNHLPRYAPKSSVTVVYQLILPDVQKKAERAPFRTENTATDFTIMHSHLKLSKIKQ